MLIKTVLQSASYASTASALSSTAGNKNVHHTSSGGTQSNTNNPPNSGSEELSLTPSRSPSTSTARSAASSGYSTSYASSSTLISPNLSHGRLSIPGYPETSVSQHSPVRRPSHGFNNISMSTPPPARYYASQVRSSSSLGHAHLQQQLPMTGSNNNSGESNQSRQQQQRFSSSSTSSSLDFASFVQTSPIGMSSTRQSYHPHGPHQQRSSDQQQERSESLISVASPASSAPTATSLVILTNAHRALTSDDSSV